MTRLFLALGVLAALVGCTHTVAHYSVVSPLELKPSRLSLCKVTRNKAQGFDQNSIVFIIPLRWRAHDMAVAMKNAIGSEPGGVALVDCEVKETKIHFPFIYGYYCYDVEGKVLVDPVLRDQILKDGARLKATAPGPESDDR
jgi:hypothetical protein